MTRKTIGCVECGESVPYGRLSCPACGALLASVAGGRALVAPVPLAPQRAVSPPRLVAPPRPVAPPVLVAPPASVPPAVPVVPLAVAEATEARVSPTRASARSPWPPMIDPPEPLLSPRPYHPFGSAPPGADDPYDRAAPPPGAYRPPTMALATAGSGTIQPSWPGPRTVARGVAGTVAGKVADATSPSTAARSDAADADRFVEIADWFVIVGASLAVLGFLLPWSVTVIGSSGFGGYFDNWGLASPTHLIILVGLLIVLALGVLQTPVPAWFGTGVLGLAIGGLLVGLVWPYLVGPLGADVGVIIVGLGGLALVVGGALASRATRHGEADPVV